jgi:hypothetical protein
MSDTEAPTGSVQNDDYVSRPGQKEAGIPVQSDGADVEDPIDAETADSDATLGKTSPSLQSATILAALGSLQPPSLTLGRYRKRRTSRNGRVKHYRREDPWSGQGEGRVH